MKPDGLRFRMTALGVVVACLFGALFVRLWYLQVLQSRPFQVAARQNGVRLVTTPAPRGRILDRNGTVIVDNRSVNVLTVDRVTIKRHPDVVHRLATLLGMTDESLRLAIADPRYGSLTPVPVAQPDAAQITYVKEHAEGFTGVDVAQQTVRSYPFGSLAAHLLGLVGEINAGELVARRAQGYGPGDTIGKSGVELAYDAALKGTPGVTKLEVDSAGSVLGTLDTQPPVQGHDVRLTVDIGIQSLAEDSLLQGLQAAQAEFNRQDGKRYPAPAGAVVVEDPRNGQVLALASQPTYNPTEFVNGISTGRFAQLNDPAQHQPLTDRATSGLYAPGSTFKLVTATAALQRGVIAPATPFVDRGFIKVGPTTFTNDGGNSYGTVNLQRALTVSSDAYFYTIGADFWEGGRSLAIQDVARQYGFGAATGIPIGGEQSGRVPDPTSRRKEYEQFPRLYTSPNWFTGDNVNLAIGQGELVVTPLQLANAYSTFANGGTLYQPQVALDVEGQDQTKTATIAAHPVRQIVLAPDQHSAMLAGFEGVVGQSDGTAAGAFSGFPLSDLAVGGKTGTAQVQGKEATSVFTAWAPAANPQFEVTVFEEQAGYGASAAAPVARRIFGGIAGLPTPPPVYIPDAAVN